MGSRRDRLSFPGINVNISGIFSENFPPLFSAPATNLSDYHNIIRFVLQYSLCSMRWALSH